MFVCLIGQGKKCDESVKSQRISISCASGNPGFEI